MPNRKPTTSDSETRSHRSDRAQPGDVLGIENDGKTTNLGDDAEDENEDLEDALDEAEEAEEEDRDD
jgi:hypothetical protein